MAFYKKCSDTDKHPAHPWTEEVRIPVGDSYEIQLEPHWCTGKD